MHSSQQKTKAVKDLAPQPYKILVAQTFWICLAPQTETPAVLQAWLSCLQVALVVPTEKGQSFQSVNETRRKHKFNIQQVKTGSKSKYVTLRIQQIILKFHEER